ncbi:MAG TPA: hypothetical protein VF517_12505 [Thermoleophilaceae bacterium]|jgi:hypothetical protein
MRTSAAAAVVAALMAVAPPAGAASYPKVEQLVVFRDGDSIQKTATAKAATVRVGGRSCTTGPSTPLAALVRIKPPKLGLRDYGSCSTRARDSAGLFVRSMNGDTNKGFDGWVYKVGQKLATAGAADPSGPFGRGRLKTGQRVTWFYCRLQGQSCERTLVVKSAPAATGQITVTVRAYDDRGKSIPAAGATVHADGSTATTGQDGSVVISLPPGTHSVYAERAGDVRSFTERIEVG